MKKSHEIIVFTAWLILCISLAMLILALTSCTTARKATNYFNRHEDTAAGYCAVKYPVKTFTKTIIKTVAGKPDTVTLQGETVYADCSEAVILALDEAARKHVGVKCPPTKVITIRDTLFTHDTTVEENTALARAWELKYYAITSDLKTMTADRDKNKGEKQRWRGLALWTWGIILILLIIAAFRFFKRITTIVG
jgi:hypothetical protein